MGVQLVNEVNKKDDGRFGACRSVDVGIVLLLLTHQLGKFDKILTMDENILLLFEQLT